MNWDTAKTFRTIRADYHQLCHLSHHYVQDTSAPLYVGYYRSRPHLHDPLHTDQFQVENQHTRGKQRHDGRRIIILQLYIQFQSCMVALFFILLSGMLGTARIIVKQHTLLEVLAGFIVGLFCGVIGILFI